MLTYMRKRSKSWITKVIFGAIIVVFVFWGGSAYLSREANKVAKIDRHIISLQQYSKAYSDMLKYYQQQFGEAFTPEMIKKLNLKTQALEQLIDDYILRVEASKLGVTVSDEELHKAIQSVPAFSDENGFNVENYKRILAYERMTPHEFEEGQRRNIFQQRVYSMITENVMVESAEVEALFKQKNDTFNLYYIPVESKRFEQVVSPDEEQIKEYYDKNRESYKIPPKIRLSYIEFPAEAYLKDIEVSQDEAKEYYDSHKDQYTSQAKVHGRHILIKVPQGADENLAAEKMAAAQKIYEEISAGGDFAELAKQYSEDPGTSFIGGDIGLVPKDSLPQQMGDKLYSMEAGQISEPVRTYLGFHILKLEEKQESKLSPFEEVSASIMDMMKHQRARILAKDHAETAFTTLYERGDAGLDTYAGDNNLKVKEIGPVTEDGTIGFVHGEEILKQAFMYPVGEVGSVADVETGYIVYMVKEKINSRIPEMNEIRGKIIIDISAEMALDKAQEHAKELIEKEPAALAELGALETGSFKRTAYSIPKLGMIPGIKDDLDVLGNPRMYTGRDKVYVVWMKEKKDADMASADTDQLDKIRDEFLERKREMAFEAYMDQAREKHKIIIVKENLS